MKDRIQPNPDLDETLAQFPKLARARELFVELFASRSPLINLGYTARQQQFALPALTLLEEQGEVKFDPKGPYLGFADPENPGIGDLQVQELENAQGFYLFGVREESTWHDKALSKEERERKLLTIIFSGKPSGNSTIIFSDFPEQVADITLFEETVELANLDYLVQQMCNYYTVAPFGLHAKKPLATIAKTVNLVSTYQAAWVDERTKLEFVAKIEIQENKPFGPTYVSYRRLTPVSDSLGKVTPFGKKANVSEEKVSKALSATKQLAVGQLVLGRVSS